MVSSFFSAFLILYKVLLTFETVDEILGSTEQYFPVVLLIMLYKVVLILKLVGKITTWLL